MSFTDEDLKRLKSIAHAYNKMTEKEVLIFTHELQALLARLEAAERFIHLGSQEQSVNPLELKQAEEAWSKSCGK